MTIKCGLAIKKELMKLSSYYFTKPCNKCVLTNLINATINLLGYFEWFSGSENKDVDLIFRETIQENKTN